MIADSGFLIALLMKDDQFHPWALNLSELFDPPFLTCEQVITEVAFILGDCRPILQMLADGRIEIALGLHDNLDEIRALVDKYADRKPDLADLCLIRLSELQPSRFIFTVDSDFLIYKRNRSEAIPLITPKRSN
jgi:predicted nucleic acid-binding protein